MTDTATGVTGALTDGTGVSKITAPKWVKDLVLDLLLALPPVFVTAQVTGIESALVVPTAVAFGIGDAVIRWGYRAALRWAQTTA